MTIGGQDHTNDRARRETVVALRDMPRNLRYDHRTSTLFIGLSGLTAAVFAADLFTPLGVAVWIFYLLPVALTLLGRDPNLPLITAFGCSLLILVTWYTDREAPSSTIAYTNRLFGGAVIWAMAFTARTLINTRQRVEAEEWIRRTQTQLLGAMQGEVPLHQIGTRALSVMTTAIEAPVGALYALAGTELRLAATHALPAGPEVPEVLELGQTVVGEAARSGRLTVLRDLPDAFFTIRSAIAAGSPRYLVVVPLLADGVVHGVLELGLVHPPPLLCLDLLERSQDAIAVAIRTALFRDRLRTLLHETQRQARRAAGAAGGAARRQRGARGAERGAQGVPGAAARSSRPSSKRPTPSSKARPQELEQQQQALWPKSRRRAEQASQYKSEFLANMSHELRTPLNSVADPRPAARREPRRPPQRRTGAATPSTIHASGNDLLTLINDILDLSKIEAGRVDLHVEDVDVRALRRGAARAPSSRSPRDAARRSPIDVAADDAGRRCTPTRERLQQVADQSAVQRLQVHDGGVGASCVVAAARSDRRRVRRSTTPAPGIADTTSSMSSSRRSARPTAAPSAGTAAPASACRFRAQLAQLLGGDSRSRARSARAAASSLVVPVRYAGRRSDAPVAAPHAAGRRPRPVSDRPRQSPRRRAGAAVASPTIAPRCRARAA